MYTSWKVLIVIIFVIIILLVIGAWGYHFILKEDWVDSFYLSALTMSSLSLEAKPKSRDQKIFIAIFTLLSIGVYLILIATIIACFLEPIFSSHRHEMSNNAHTRYSYDIFDFNKN